MNRLNKETAVEKSQRFGRWFVRARLAVLLPFMAALFLAALAAPAMKAQVQNSSPALKPELQPLSFFIGQWACAGEFVATKKPITSRISVSPDLDGSWLAFRWDDNAPNVFHALELWGFDKAANHFTNFIHDNFGGVRLLNSSGWDGDTLIWIGDALANPPATNQRFVIARKSPKEFIISWEVRKPQADWVVGDRLTCTQE